MTKVLRTKNMSKIKEAKKKYKILLWSLKKSYKFNKLNAMAQPYYVSVAHMMTLMAFNE